MHAAKWTNFPTELPVYGEHEHIAQNRRFMSFRPLWPEQRQHDEMLLEYILCSRRGIVAIGCDCV